MVVKTHNANSVPALRLLSCCLVSIVLLCGCSKETEEQALMQTYLKRVANVLDQPLPQNTLLPNLPALPPTRDRHQETSAIREGLLDLLELADCNLIHLVAERNSTLGKVSAPSQKLAYEVAFYQRLIECIPLLEQTPDTKPATLSRVRHIAQIKYNELPKHLWNALYTGQEIEQSLSLNQLALPLSTTDENPRQNALTSWQFFAQLSLHLEHQDYGAANKQLSQIELHMESLYKNPIGTPLLRSLILITHYLNQTAEVIEGRLARRPLCFNDMSNPKADILKTVFTRFYAAQIQPYMANTHRVGEQWFTAHHTIHNFARPPAAIAEYDAKVFNRITDISIWNQYVKARNRHTKAWQHILSQCKLMPSANNR